MRNCSRRHDRFPKTISLTGHQHARCSDDVSGLQLAATIVHEEAPGLRQAAEDRHTVLATRVLEHLAIRDGNHDVVTHRVATTRAPVYCNKTCTG